MSEQRLVLAYSAGRTFKVIQGYVRSECINKW